MQVTTFKRNRCEHAKIITNLGCSNEGDRKSKKTTCIATDRAICENIGDDRHQSNSCAYKGLVGCSNIGDGNTQTNNCTLVFCNNSGDNSIQTNNCRGKEDPLGGAGGFCDNQGSGSTQSITCVNVGSQPPSGDCTNGGDETVSVHYLCKNGKRMF